MIPDMADVLLEWQVPVILKTVSHTTVNFEPVDTVTVAAINAVAQPPTPEQLNAADIDWSRKHFTFHSVTPINLGQYVEYLGADYKIITDGAWDLYGYSEVIGEETKQSLLVATP